jgi:hypothetical protein
VFTLQYFPSTKIIDYAISAGYLQKDAKKELLESCSQESFIRVKRDAAYKHLDCVIPLLSLSVFLPRFVTRYLLKNNNISVLNYFPSGALLVLRAISAIFRKGDTTGRGHILSVWYSLFGHTLKPDLKLISSLKELTSLKSDLPEGLH